jgi:pyruvate-ferredoxin/flavodoxin oxidoreductase
VFEKLKQLKLLESRAAGGTTRSFKYPGKRDAVDGNTAVVLCEREASDAAGAYPITPSTQMGEYWAEAASAGHINISGRPLIFLEPESEHAAAGITAGMSMTGLRGTNFSSGQGVAFMHESLYAAVGKRLPYVLNMGCRAITKTTLNVHCGHDDYHCVDDTGFIQVLAKSAQEAADLNIITRKAAELALTPAVVGQDGFLTTHLIESVRVPERELIAEYLGRPDDIIDTPTAAQRMIYGDKRRRIPAIWDVDNPMVSGVVQNQDAYMQAVAAQRPYFFDHIEELAEQCMEEFYQLTGRRYRRVGTYRTEDADYLILGMGSMIVQAEAVADYLRESRKLKVGVVNITMYRPFPGDLLGHIIKGKKGVAVLERTDQPLAEDLPLMREVRATLTKCLENGASPDAYRGYAAYRAPADMPRLYSGCYGLGSRDLQPEALIGAVENMLPRAAQRKFFYLSVDFVREQPVSPKDEIHNQQLLEAYPAIRELAVRGSENPNLMPKDAITVRMHSIGGWGAITTGKNLAVTLFDLLGYDIKANPKYGSEKKGQPTTYYLSAAPEPIRVNCEYHYVDVVISPDPNVFGHSNPLSGLKKGGVFIIQSALDSPEQVWASFPLSAQKFIADNEIRVFYIDGFSIARQEATTADLQLRMQGIAFQGAFFAASPVMEQAGLSEERLFKSIEEQLLSKFGAKGKHVVEENLKVVRRGFSELKEIAEKPLGASQRSLAARKDAGLPLMLKRMPEGDCRLSDMHRFWEQTASFYATGKGSDNLADPFIGLSLVPAATGLFRDMTQIRFEHPVWVAENCTACGKCYTACPDSAIPGLVSSVADVFNTAVTRVETGGHPTRYLRRALRITEKKLRALIEPAGEAAKVRELLSQAIDQTIAESPDTEREKLTEEFARFCGQLGEFDFSITKPYWTGREKKAQGCGGLLSITVNPYTCKGCELCVQVCEDEALAMTTQTAESVERLRHDWKFWLDLPTTPKEFSRIESLDEKIGALDTLLLDKRNYGSLNCGDGACLGCGEKTVLHLFTATVTALMQPRVKAYVEKIDGLIAGLEKHIRMKLTENLDLSDTEAMIQAVDAHGGDDLTVANLAAHLTRNKPTMPPLDPSWVRWASQLLEKLRRLRWHYVEGPSKRGRAEMGIINATGCTSIWGSTFPYSPYPFPWSSHLFQDSPSVAMGVFEGHMTKMAEGFKAVRMAELELAGEYDALKHDEFFTRFDWQQLSEEEWLLCPPVTAVGGDGAMYDIGFQNLSRALISGLPIKVVVVDTQVYSNTGGQACTSGFISQVSDMAAYGAAQSGKQETRKEISLIGMAHRTAYVLQSTVANVNHLLEGFIDGLNSRRPALFNIYASCPVEHGIANDATVKQSKLAVEARAYPLVKFDPDAGTTFTECVSLEGNPALEEDWPTYTLKYLDDDGKEASLSLPLTFADFAATEGRFSKQFKKAPPATWNDDMLPMADFIRLGREEREGKFPYIWAVDEKNRLTRLLVSKDLARSTEERLAFWQQLKNVAGVDRTAVDEEAIATRARAELLQQLTAGAAAMSAAHASTAASAAAKTGAGTTVAAQVYEPVWVDTPECTACDECINLAPKAFAYNERKQAVVIDPKGAKFADLVRAAEKCTACAIHPGTPWNPSEPGLEKLRVRAAKFN